MSTAARTIDCTPAPTPEQGEVYQLVSDVIRLERENNELRVDLTSVRTRARTFERALRSALEAPKLIGQSVVDGMLTVTYSNGRVVQLQPTAYYHEDSTEYRTEWRDLVPAPDTAKAIVVNALGDDDLDALPFLGGMSVVS
jgi:hypothetical protein